MLRTTVAFPAFLLLLATMPVRAQFAREDFAFTDCGQAESLFRSGLETAEQAGVSASGGAGGDASGAISLQISVPDTSRTQTFLLHVPMGYHDQAAWPLVVALHGSPGSAAAAPAAAEAIRDLWQPLANREGVLVLAPIASGPQSGGWVPSLDTPALACALAGIERAWNVDRARRYLWGFSAGGHYGHGLALGNAGRFAAYAVNAGALQAFACGSPGSPSDCAVTLPQVARRIPVSLRVGVQDPLLPYVSGDAGRFQTAGWTAATDLLYATFVGGHTVEATDAETAWAWFQTHSISP